MIDLSVRAAHEEDMEAVAVFMRSQGSQHTTAERLRHWYFANPSGSASVIIGDRGGRVVGMATANGHRFHRSGESALVAMPQKVLTDASMRGKGVFGRLYRACEEACFAKGSDFLLTATNAASTPIFLGRFGYARMPSPRVTVLAPLPGRLRTWTGTVGEGNGVTGAREAWSMRKDAAHRRWRYAEDIGLDYLVLSAGTAERPVGRIWARRVRRMGVPLLLVLDLAPGDAGTIPELLRQARRLAWRERAAAALVLREGHLAEHLDASWPATERSSGLNLLVKGKDEAHTRALADQGFELAFGDLDFF